jgi:hypothetical protein
MRAGARTRRCRLHSSALAFEATHSTNADGGDDDADDEKSMNGTILQTERCPIFDDSELVLAIAVEGCAGYTKKQIADLTKVGVFFFLACVELPPHQCQSHTLRPHQANATKHLSARPKPNRWPRVTARQAWPLSRTSRAGRRQ